MARPRSEAREKAILAAAARVIAAQGLGAATAAIAKEAGVSNGSLFLYFNTKATLVNALYVDLKTEMAAAADDGLPVEAEPREQLRHIWTQWLRWATSNPDRRRALAQLEVADEITSESHQTAARVQQGSAALVQLIHAKGPMREVSVGFALRLAGAVADAAMDAVIREPDQAQVHGDAGFEAIWRMLAGNEFSGP